MGSRSELCARLKEEGLTNIFGFLLYRPKENRPGDGLRLVLYAAANDQPDLGIVGGLVGGTEPVQVTQRVFESEAEFDKFSLPKGSMVIAHKLAESQAVDSMMERFEPKPFKERPKRPEVAEFRDFGSQALPEL